MLPRKMIAVIAALVLTSVGSAFAAVNNMNSRGQFVPMGSNLSVPRGYARPSYQTYSRAPMYRAPAVVTAPAPMVAAAPAEGRRFSYAPSAPAVMAAAPCPTATANVPPANSVRRYSYDPSAGATVAPAPAAAPRVYAPAPRTGGSYRSNAGNVERWKLPKTDARKYTTH